MAEETEANDACDYTREQKIVSAVWVHERNINEQKWSDINKNFRLRFNQAPPMRSTLLSWEKKLFSTGCVDDNERAVGRPIARLMHVPYVKASLEESPDLSLRERAKILGLPSTTLLTILREDLNMKFEIENEAGEKLPKRQIAGCNGRWKKKIKESVKKESELDDTSPDSLDVDTN